MNKVTAIIVAGGSGKRMGTAVKKQYIQLKGKEILAYTIEAFENCSFINDIIVVVAEEEIDYVRENIIRKYKLNKVSQIVGGGKERQDSVYNGLKATKGESTYVMIHDGARPFVKKETIYKCLLNTQKNKASIVAVPVKDTIKVCNTRTHRVESTPDRKKLWSIQTPQSFEYELLMKAYSYAKKQNLQVTDDSMIIEAFGEDVYITEGDYTNIKITTPEDLIIGEVLLQK
ncbi:2-C-methyl-D-erythritol 4-phosphate cytidylyltransferase [Sporanaerobium hydrogeniformans]|uniref:2-C-methyl-D-erythritol 4-phosphate cytidylyltransferase n=1 Tax=Sporanaerobium hydrogeniformans TaxID=3072179 RepID=A0AC61DEC4_9FIRM|nr:2-C-methyl-D-erythritol 4-phosphate cytidylyltransferase [Sporanaerobium hydrogeniformans]PHV71183.1 2-C-methyl-D-erythritol 4-phosphate cytidylyltransferase [Sporanaerobium hydrogeniformans]